MPLEQQERKSLHRVLLQTFVGPDDLELFADLELGVRLYDVVEEQPLPAMLLKLINWCDTRGRAEDLVKAALERTGRNGEARDALTTILTTLAGRDGARSLLKRMPTIDQLADIVRHQQEQIAELQRTLTAGSIAPANRAVEKLQDAGENASLTSEEASSLETIVLSAGRPALLVQNGTFAAPPSTWSILNDHRPAIDAVARSVGRVEVEGHAHFTWLGTAFLVAPTVAATAGYVARELYMGAATFGPHALRQGLRAWVNFRAEVGSGVTDNCGITDVIGVHPSLDVAFLRLAADERAWSRLPLRIGDPTRAGVESPVYLIGFPARDSRRPPDIMEKVFGNIFDVKRLQPGRIVSVEPATVKHDCSTLGGNGGSPLLDLSSHQVIGVHARGRHLEPGEAVRLDGLRQDPVWMRALR